MLINILLIIVGLAILIVGAEGLVRGSASLASKLRIAPLIIGLTVVAFGTSAPELTVNIISAINGSGDLALGNILGSNIANILLILGVVAVITPLAVKSNTVWKEIPFALLAVFLLLVMANDVFLDGDSANAISRTDGILLMSLMGIFMFYIINMAIRQRNGEEEVVDDKEAEKIHEYSFWASIGLVVAGLAGLIIGGRILVDNAVSLAQAAGLSEAFIGLTIVAVGTSLPELATSVVAALRKHADIAIGNVVGSNIFNIFWVLGLTGTILPLTISSDIILDIFVTLGATALLFVFMFVGGKRRLVRWEGVTFLLLYAIYIAFLVIRG